MNPLNPLLAGPQIRRTIRRFRQPKKQYHIFSDSLSRIPATGPAIIVANHPFGGIEPVVLAEALSGIRSDFKVAPDELTSPRDSKRLLKVDPLGEGEPARASRQECIDWVRKGGLLALVPSREVSRIDLIHRTVIDPNWRRPLAQIVRATEAPVVPVFFEGYNPVFNILDFIHHRLKTIVRPFEMDASKLVCVHVGTEVPFKKVVEMNDNEMLEYLRMRTYILGNTQNAPSRARSLFSNPPEEVAAPVDPAALAAEVGGLPPDLTLNTMGDLSVICAHAKQIPQTLREIGRLREVTFRAVNEGTGKAFDLDRFDEDYRHLFVWNQRKKDVVGAYRMGLTDELLSKHGKGALYTSTLFKFKRGMLECITPAIELGRSFVRAEYQRDYAPLMLLWKGIAQFVVRNPQYRYLFGPVSINEQYNSISRQLMLKFLQANNYERELAELVEARKPMKVEQIKGWEPVNDGFLADIEEVSNLVSDLEADGKGVPILLRQYLRLGGKLLGCNIDPDFSNVLDALILVDLAATDPRILSRYMSKEEAKKFYAYHGRKV